MTFPSFEPRASIAPFSELHLPLHMAKVWNLLATEGVAIEKQFNLIEIRVHPHGDLLAFPALEVPVRKQVKRRLLSHQAL